MLITKISELRSSREFSNKMEADFKILQKKHYALAEDARELTIMMNNYQKNVDRYKEETEEFIKLLRNDNDYKKN